MKVNVWQVGYTTQRDSVIGDPNLAECRPMGYVIVEDDEEDWEDDAWHLLNWGCWNYPKGGGRAIKPEEVQSPLSFCNSDVILQREGTDLYYCADHCGWTKTSSLDRAVAIIRNGYHSIWPFKDVKFSGGHTKVENGKAYISDKHDGPWREITW